MTLPIGRSEGGFEDDPTGAMAGLRRVFQKSFTYIRVDRHATRLEYGATIGVLAKTNRDD